MRGMNSDGGSESQLLDARRRRLSTSTCDDTRCPHCLGDRRAQRLEGAQMQLRLKEADHPESHALALDTDRLETTWTLWSVKVSDLNRRRVRIRSLAKQETFLRMAAMVRRTISNYRVVCRQLDRPGSWRGGLSPGERGRQKAAPLPGSNVSDCRVGCSIFGGLVQDEGGGPGGGCC